MNARTIGFSAVFLIVIATPAFAQDARPEEPNESSQRQESRAAFRSGVAALQKQRWVEARDDFVHAYKLFPHPSILLDLGVSRSHVGEVVEAEQDLTRFLAEDTGASADEIQTARTTLESVRTHIGTLRVRVSPPGATASIDDKPIALASAELTDVRVSRGSHALEASASGYDTWSGRVDVDGPDAKIVDLTLTAHPEADHAALPTPRIVAVVLFGAGIASAAFGIFAGAHAIDLANQYNTPTEANYQNASTKSDGIAFRTTADVTLGFALACAIGGAVLWFTTPKKKKAALAFTPFGLYARF